MRKHLTRGLRFRLTASYVLFFTLLLTLVSALFRQNLASSLDQNLRDGLNQDWAAVKGYLRIEHDYIKWFFDIHDPDEASIKGRLQKSYLLTNAQGVVLEESPAYHQLGTDSPAFIRSVLQSAQQPIWRERRDPRGVAYLVRSSFVWDEEHTQKYYVSIARSLTDNHKILQQFTWLCVGLIPLMILGGCIVGWVYAGRALMPVLEVAQTAQRITGSNLSLRIPTREAGDELDTLIETFNRMIERLENSFNQIRQFSTDVSHELRTPITVIRGQLEVALFTADTKEQYREAILNSLQDIERLSQIVRALLLLSQAETGQVVLQKTTMDLAEIARDIVDQFQIPAEGAQVRLSLAPPPDGCLVEVDRVQIERMFSNLLSNSIKFTPPGGEIHVAVGKNQDRLELIIEDTGYGIPTEHLPHIFDRFYRVAGAESLSSPEKGLGLGLSFVAWIVKAHEGTIDVQSAPGTGTRFSISLPAAPPVPQPQESPEMPISAAR